MPGGAWLGNPQHKERSDIEERLKRHKAALLTEAAHSSDASRVRELLSDRADPNMADESPGSCKKNSVFELPEQGNHVLCMYPGHDH